MGRWPCFIPENKGGVLVELTGRTIGARALLVPSPNPRLSWGRATGFPDGDTNFLGGMVVRRHQNTYTYR